MFIIKMKMKKIIIEIIFKYYAENVIS